MKINYLVFFLFLSIYKLSAQTPSEDKNWEIVFYDDFDFLNTQNWRVQNDFDHYGEPQMYTSRNKNVYCSDGNLVLKAYKEKYLNHNYTSGWINTKSMYLYGYFEIKCKLPKGKGFWPAFWTTDGHCPTTGFYNEIDIFEMDGSFPNETTNNLHTCNHHKFSEHFCEDYSADFHSYSAEWRPDRLVFYLDDKNIRSEKNIFGLDYPQTVIANLAILPWDLPDASTVFPSSMLIDYIKIYQLKMDCNTIVNNIPDFKTFNFAVKKSISLNNNLTIVPKNENITLRANDFIELKSGFEVPIGTQFTIYATSCY